MNSQSAVQYLKGQRLFVDLGFIKDGRKQIVYPKVASLEGDVKQLIEQLLTTNKEVIADSYKPNGSSKKFDRSLTITKEALGSTPSMFREPETIRPKPTHSMESSDWKDYALKTEQGKNEKLERELIQLRGENKELDNKVREFEKEVLKKDFEIEKLNGSVESKSGLGGFATGVLSNPTQLEALTTAAIKIINGVSAPAAASGTTTTDSPQLPDPTTEKYVENIKDWLYTQTDEKQARFYKLIVNVCKTKDETLLDQLITLSE